LAVVAVVLGLEGTLVSGDDLKIVGRTQNAQITQNAMASRPALAINGAFLVPVNWTSHSLNTPDKIATILFIVVITPNMLLKLVPAWSKCLLWYSVTIQLSKAEYIKLVLNPPKTRPKNKAYRFGISVEKHAIEYVTQNTIQAALRPYLSANCPTKYPEMPPERNPVVKRAATISSLRPNWSLYKLYTYGPARISFELQY
jgi:hypothetical protein